MRTQRKGPVPKRGGLPFVFLNAAVSADGKLAPATRQYKPFGSRHDQALLYELRAWADAVMCGARTVDLQPIKLGVGAAKYRCLRLRRGLAEYPLRVIVSGSGSVDPRAEIFKHHFSPIIILTTRRAGHRRLNRLRALADDVHVCGERSISFPLALRWLRKTWKVKSLLGEGGGQLNSALLAAGLVNEIHVTICPVVIGGRQAPTLADGGGVRRLSQAIRLALKSRRQVGHEMFLCYRVRPRAAASKPI